MLLQSAGLTYGFIRGDILPQDLDQGTVPAPLISRQVVVYSCIHTIIREREREGGFRSDCAQKRESAYPRDICINWRGSSRDRMKINRGNEYSDIKCKFREKNSEFEKFRCNITRNESLVVNGEFSDPNCESSSKFEKKKKKN